MHGTAPLLRSVATFVSHSQSRIPHLRCHIVLRQTRSRQPRQNVTPASGQQRRCQSTFVPIGYLDEASETSKTEDEIPKTSRVGMMAKESNTQDRSLQSMGDTAAVSKSANMFDILEEGLPDRILSALMSDSVGTPFIQQAHDQVFNKALLMLDPEYFIEPFKDVSRHLKGYRGSNVLRVKSIDERLATFAAYLDRIVAVRREGGKKMNVEACNHLLKWAATMGDKQLATSVLSSIMPADGVDPTFESYNYYSQALVWSHAFSSTENYNLRVIPRHLQIRGTRLPPRALSGHSTSNPMKGIKGLREEILDVFKTCISKGYATDEFMFTNLMTAMGREADLGGVKSILKSVWNIDVDLLDVYDEEEVESPTFYEKDHHLRPSERLLFTVAHVFGSNNDIRTAWLLVDFISRYYDLPITKRVWTHLCEWGFVLSVRRSKAGHDKGRGAGQIPHETFVKILETMVDKPHNIEPDAFIHFLLSRSWRDRNQLDMTAHHVQKLDQLVAQQLKIVNTLKKRVMGYTDKAISMRQVDAFETDLFYSLRRQFIIEFHELQRRLQFMNVAVNRTLLGHNDWAGAGKLTEWERRKLPQFVELYQSYLANHVIYNTKTGTVELNTKHKRRAGTYTKHKTDYRVFPTVMNAIDTEDQARLNRRMETLSKVLIETKEYCFSCESIGHTHDCCPNAPFTSGALDYRGEVGESDVGSADSSIFVHDPRLSGQLAPSGLEPANHKERTRPTLPFL